MFSKMSEIQSIVKDGPKESVFEVLDTVWRRDQPDEPSLLLQRKVFEAVKEYHGQVHAEGGHKNSPNQKIAEYVLDLATVPDTESGERQELLIA